MPSGAQVLIDVLKTENVSHVFGNPGTTELALVDALSDYPEIEYVLGLQEATVVGLADGYARSNNCPAFVNLHATAGLGNGLGALSNAAYRNVPMVVSAGQQDYRHIVDDPWLSGDLVALAKPLCKWAHEIRTIDELGTIMRRAFKDANTYPKGPVFVSLPQNFMEAETDCLAPPKSHVNTESVAGGLDELVATLNTCDASEIAIVAGDEISDSDAFDETILLAEALGADVYGSALHESVVFPSSHPLWKGTLKPITAEISESLSPYKKIFLLGARSFMAYVYTPTSPVPKSADLLHLSSDVNALAMTFNTEWAGVGNIKPSIAYLLKVLSTKDKTTAKNRIELLKKEKETAWSARVSELNSQLEIKPALPEVATYAFIQSLPKDAIIVDECPAAMWSVREFFQTNKNNQYHFSKGGGLGWGMPSSVGICLANERKRTFCMIGDGAAMYSPQALWTAANLKLPIMYLVFNNAEYGILKNYLRKTYPEKGDRDDFIGMDVNSPAIDYIALAKSMGVAGVSIDSAAKIAETVDKMLETYPNEPCLIEVKIAPSGGL